MQEILQTFGIKEKSKVKPFGNGLINHTWKVSTPNQKFILQCINNTVFSQPADIAGNTRLIADYLSRNSPDYLFVTPIASNNNGDLVYVEGAGYFRMFPFVNNSYTKNVVETPEQAFEAAAQFGKFTRLLSGFDARQLKITIPDFHNLSLRYQQFLAAIENGNRERVAESESLIQRLKSHSGIVMVFEDIQTNPHFKLRVTHHDTKISNVLFDAQDKGICVIDLDTVMPGYFISDVGDMMRTYLSPVSEEEQDVSKIRVREEIYKAVVEGYYAEMKRELTTQENECFFYAGQFMIYMQSLRFLTDHLNDDVYYGARYPGHNLMRAKNQLVLLEELLKKQKVLEHCIAL
jgi:Ser/Thr protein kinase RdoA (MazF antagonist)